MKCFKILVMYSHKRGGASDSIYLPLMGITAPTSTKVNSQIAPKMLDVGYPLSMANGMIYYQETYPLLISIFQAFLGSIMQMRRACDNIWKTLVGITVSYLTDVNSQIAGKI